MARGRRARQLGSRRRFAIRCSLLQLRVRGRLDLGFGASARAGRAVEAVLLWAAALTFSCKAGPSLRFARGQAPSLRTTTSGSFASLRTTTSRSFASLRTTREGYEHRRSVEAAARADASGVVGLRRTQGSAGAR